MTPSYTHLYEFTLGNKVWRYTANAEDVIDPDENVWEATAISDDGVSTSGEAAADQMGIDCSSDIVPARIWMYSRPSKIMDVRILRAQLPARVSRGDDEGVAAVAPSRVIPVTNVRVRYVGEVSQCSFGQLGSAKFTCETLSATMQREGLRLTWQRSCPYTIYDPLTCRVNKVLWATTATVVSISGNTVELSTIGTGNYVGGLLEYVHPVKGDESLTIESFSGTQVTIFDTAADLYVGQQVTVYPGCDGTPASCVEFGNMVNNGGIKDLPGESPFDGVNNPVF